MKIIVSNNNKDNISSEEYLSDNKSVIFKFESDLNKNFSFTKNKNYIFHLNVLPQPFFGEINDPDILIIAKNPSYAKNEDEQDTYLYLKNHINLDCYYENLKEVNFFKNWSAGENLSFINTWNWWNKRVIGGAHLKNSETKIGIINLCAYHSKYFLNDHYEYLPFLSVNEIVEIIKKAKFVIFVWNGAFLDSFKNVIVKDRYVVLNRYIDCNFNYKYGTNLNSIKSVISNKKELYEKSIVSKLNEYFI